MAHHLEDQAINSIAKAFATAHLFQKKAAVRSSRLDEYVRTTIKRMEMEENMPTHKNNENWHLYVLRERGIHTVWEKRGKVDRRHDIEEYQSDVHARWYIDGQVQRTNETRGDIKYHRAKLA